MGDSFHVRLSKRKADAAIGPSTPVSSMLQKKADNTTPTIQAVIHLSAPQISPILINVRTLGSLNNWGVNPSLP